jgi:hypothetical protein
MNPLRESANALYAACVCSYRMLKNRHQGDLINQ